MIISTSCPCKILRKNYYNLYPSPLGNWFGRHSHEKYYDINKLVGSGYQVNHWWFKNWECEAYKCNGPPVAGKILTPEKFPWENSVLFRWTKLSNNCNKLKETLTMQIRFGIALIPNLSHLSLFWKLSSCYCSFNVRNYNKQLAKIKLKEWKKGEPRIQM